MDRFYNTVGVLTWKADPVWAETLNAAWNDATHKSERSIAAMMIPNPPEDSRDKWIERAKAEVIAACVDGKLQSFGHTADNEESRAVPPTGWLGVKIDEVSSSVRKEKPTWLGIYFNADTVRSLWPASPLTVAGRPKKRTGPRPKYLRAAQDIARQCEIAAAKADADGVEQPPWPTAKQVTDKLEQLLGHPVSARTVRRTWESLRGTN